MLQHLLSYRKAKLIQGQTIDQILTHLNQQDGAEIKKYITKVINTIRNKYLNNLQDLKLESEVLCVDPSDFMSKNSYTIEGIVVYMDDDYIIICDKKFFNTQRVYRVHKKFILKISKNDIDSIHVLTQLRLLQEELESNPPPANPPPAHPPPVNLSPEIPR